MSWQPPPSANVWKAIELYLALAYDSAPPAAVRARLDVLKSAEGAAFYRTKAFEYAPAAEVNRYMLRLGNRFYPHMKLVVERSPDLVNSMFRADTHDRHVQLAPDSPEAAAMADLTRNNQELSQQIESAWDAHGLPTFKQYLREDLARRRAAAQASHREGTGDS